MKSTRVWTGLMLVALMALAGCGGASKTTGPGGGDNGGGGGGTGGGTPGTPVSDSARAVVFDTTARYIQTLPNLSTSTTLQSLATFLAKRKEFSDVGWNAGCAWAKFTDGRYLFFEDENTGEPTVPATAARSAAGLRDPRLYATPSSPIAQPAGLKSPLASRCGMPSSNVAWIYATRVQRSGVADWVQEATNCLNQTGYNARIKWNAGVADFITLPVCGVLGIDTHGSYKSSAERESSSVDVYAMWTGTPRSSDLDDRYRAYLDQGLLCYYWRWDPKPFGTTCYAITAKGAQQWFHFAPNAFVYCNTCRGFASQGWISAFTSNGVSLYAGWTLKSYHGVGGATASYVFDRLSGANVVNTSEVPIESPPQRPFNYGALLGDMTAKSLGTFYDPDYNGQSLLSWAPGPGDCGMLAPSITYMDFDDENKQLTLTGLFGIEQGEVRVNDTGVTIDSWSPTSIVCEVPDNGASSAGLVQVIVHDHKSNPRYLTEWRGRVTYEEKHNENATDAALVGTYNTRVDMDLHFRSDIQDYREEPGKAPKYRQYVTYNLAKDSKCNWTASGMLTRYVAAGTSQVLCQANCAGSGGSIDEGHRGAGDEFAGGGAFLPGGNICVLDLVGGKDKVITVGVTSAAGSGTEHWDLRANFYPGSLRSDVENATVDASSRDVKNQSKSVDGTTLVGNSLLGQVPVTVHYTRNTLSAVPSTVPPDDNPRSPRYSTLKLNVRAFGGRPH